MDEFSENFRNLSCSNSTHLSHETFDLMQSIARSRYGDMLLDCERNHLYFKAINKYAQSFDYSQSLKVLDIGTGTGLLSMMICKAFNRSVLVTALESSEPISQIARKIIEKNGYQDVIIVVNTLSTLYHCNPEEKADILIAEVFDTELIGEGALSVYRWAVKNQIKPNAIIIPAKARIWIQLATSKWLSSGHCLRPINILKCQQDKLSKCAGSNELNDIQASQLILNEDVKLISEPQVAFTFDFKNIDTLKEKAMQIVEFIIKENVNDESLVIIFWWDLFMDQDEKILLSCAPYWAHHNGHNLSWRDHWIQAIYYLPSYLSFKLQKDDSLAVFCHRDDMSFWFDIKQSDPPSCSCGIHTFISRSRLRYINCTERVISVCNHIAKEIDPLSTLTYVGASSFLPLLFPDIEIFSDKQSKIFFESFDKKVSNLDNISNLSRVIISDPFSGNLPWESLDFLKMVSKIKKQTNNKNVKIFPNKAMIKMIPVTFEHLWKIRARIPNVEGFDLSHFDDAVRKAIDLVDPIIESHPLWEYPCYPLSDEIDLFYFDLLDELDDDTQILNKSINIQFSMNKNKNVCLVFWMLYEFNGYILSTGPVKEIRKNCKIAWNKEWKQGVLFNDVNCELEHNDKNELNVNCLISIDLEFDENRMLNVKHLETCKK